MPRYKVTLEVIVESTDIGNATNMLRQITNPSGYMVPSMPVPRIVKVEEVQEPETAPKL